MKILMTGANGLIGRALCSVLDHSEHQIIRTVRTSTTPWEIPVGDLNENTYWGEVLSSGIDVVVHLAGQVPLTDGETGVQANRYYQVNTLGTANLARQCAQHGVKRFIFVSTVKVLGKGKDESYRDDDLAVPADAYAISKWEAEQVLWRVALDTGMEVVIIRPPLVYGPGVKGNLASLIRVVAKGLALPLGAIHNRRSLVGLDNLVDLIVTCVNHPAAANQVFLAGDGQDLSTTELLRSIARAMGKPSRLIPVPACVLMLGATLLGKKAMAQRLLGSLQVDISKARTVLGWEPPVSVEDGIKRMVDG